MTVRRRAAVPVPTPWFAAAVAVTALALFAWPGRSWTALAVVEIALLGLFAIDTALCASPRDIEVTRDAPAAVRVGDSATVSWVVENRASRTASIVVTDALWPSLSPSRRTLRITLVPARRVRATAEITPRRRGRFPLSHVTVRVFGPLRLAARQAGRAVITTIRVLPAYPSQPEIRRRVRLRRVPDAGVRTLRSAGAGTEFDQLRDYRPDDEFRRIDWATTMRMQRPIVKQYRIERNQNVVALLDNGRTMAASVGGTPRVEHGMDAVLALADASTEIGDRFGLVCFDRAVRAVIQPRGGRGQVARVAESMYTLEPDLAESAYTAAFALAAARFHRRSLYVVIAELAEATVDQALAPALSILVRRHLVVVGSVRDPVVAGWARPGDQDGPRWASQVYRSAAAVHALQSRERAAARLRATGAIVVDAEPGRLAAELVDTYLVLKATGRL